MRTSWQTQRASSRACASGSASSGTPPHSRTAIRDHAFGVDQPTGPTEFARAASPGLWRENLSSEEQRTTTEIMGKQLAALGYCVQRQREDRG